MTIPAMQVVSPAGFLNDLGFVTLADPGVAGWFTAETQTVFGKEPLGWMLAQGWIVDGVSDDPDSPLVPPEKVYNLRRNTMDNQAVLTRLVADYINAYNQALSNNDTRYDDIISAWADLTSKTRVQLDAVGDAHDAYETVLLNWLGQAYLDANASINSALSVVSSAFNNATAGLSVFNASLTSLGAGYDDFETAIEGLLSSQASSLATYLSAIDGIRLQLQSDYDAHAATARALLVDLGATELARINEAYDNDLAQQLQQLVDRGYYASGGVTDITARNTRERNEAITKHNDQLAREQLENEHRLYGALVGVRQGIVGIRDKYRNAQDEAYKFTATMRDRLLTLLNGYVDQYLRGKGQYVELSLRQGGFSYDARIKAINEEMQAKLALAQGYNQAESDQQQVMQFQVRAHNEVVLGLFGFCERRTDEGPDISSIGQVAAALGDAGATQIVRP